MVPPCLDRHKEPRFAPTVVVRTLPRDSAYASGRRQDRGSKRQRGFSGDRQKQGRLRIAQGRVNRLKFRAQRPLSFSAEAAYRAQGQRRP